MQLLDVADILFAAMLAAVVFLPFGWLVGYSLDVFGFRAADPWDQLGRAIVLSTSLCPITSYLLARAGGTQEVPWLYLGATVLALGLAVLRRRNVADAARIALIDLRRNWPIATILGVWVVVAVLILVEIVWDNVLLNPHTTFDYTKHVAVTDAISRTGIPPVNPSFRPCHAIPLFYYYFWFMLCAQLHALCPVAITVYGAVCGMTIWSGFGLVAAVKMWWTRFADSTAALPRPLSLLGVLFVPTGLDVFMVLWAAMRTGRLGDVIRAHPSVEWWNVQGASFLDFLLWVPHHVGGFVACLFAMACLRHCAENETETRQSAIYATLAGAAFASAAGLSIWVTLVGASILCAWLVVCVFRGWRREAGLLLAAGAVGIVAVAPYAYDLKMAGERKNSPVAFEVRQFSPLERWLDGKGVSSSSPLRSLLRLGVLPLSYAIELGCFALGSLLFWRQRRHRIVALSKDEWFLLVMAAVAALVCTFVRSAILNNDLGSRGFMFALLPMILWTADYLDGQGCSNAIAKNTLVGFPGSIIDRLGRRALWVAIALGIAGTSYNLFAIRVNRWTNSGLAIREAYHWARENTPTTAVFQHNPRVFTEYFHGLYGNRQVVAADEQYGPLYGIDPDHFDRVEVPLYSMFLPNSTWRLVQEVGGKFDIDFIVVKAGDPVWDFADSWVWKRSPVFENASVRIFSVPRTVNEVPR